ncbi:hypothetical protein PS838_05017 [Pseudomonas fluorescens]|nr:hypothetical protein PS838_05017 [Pseudomonas fluorescens]
MNRTAYLLALCSILFYFPSGLLKSHLSQFLVNSGFSYSVAGLIVGSTFLVKSFVTPIITLFADHTHSKQLLNILFSMLAAASVIVVSINQSVIVLATGIVLLMVSRSYFQNILESTAATAQHDGAQGGYGRVRFAGSLSVAIGAATMAGLITLGLAPDQIFIWILTLSSLLFAAVFTWASEKEPPQKEITSPSFKPSRLKRSAFLMFTAAALIIGAQGAYYSIGTPWFKTMGLSGSQIFIAWTIGFITEALAFRYSNALMPRHYCIVIPMVGMCCILRAFFNLGLPRIDASGGFVRTARRNVFHSTCCVRDFDPPLLLYTLFSDRHISILRRSSRYRHYYFFRYFRADIRPLRWVGLGFARSVRGNRLCCLDGFV